MKTVFAAALILSAAALTGCASGPIAAHQPTLDNVAVLRDAAITPMAVGDFKLAQGVEAQVDKSVSVRGSSVTSPSNKSFSAYLKDSIVTELTSAGKYAPTSDVSVSGELLENELNAAGVSTANATLAARFRVRRDGAAPYDKVLREHDEWKSSFMGAIAIPDAINHYGELYTKLLRQLFSDPEFKATVRSK